MDTINKPLYVRSEKHRKLGLFFLIGPTAILVSIFLAYAIVNFFVIVFLSDSPVVDSSGTDLRSGIVSLINYLLGFIGLLAVVTLIVGIPLGIFLLSKKKLAEGEVTFDERSGRGKESITPLDIRGWNWGASGLTWIWGAYYSVWISLLTFVPVVSFVMWIILGLKGNEWAWRAERWKSTEEFLRSQRKWRVWGIIFTIFHLLPLLYLLVTLFSPSTFET